MCFSCDYCPHPMPGVPLRMVEDPSIGGALQMCCHDCWHREFVEAHCDDSDDCEWLALKTADEWAEERQTQAEMRAEALADKADARRFNLAEWVMFG